MPDPTVIALTGELDVARVDALRATLEAAIANSEDGLVVDLSDVAFIDSSGLAPILEAKERLRRQRSAFAVVAPRGTAAAELLTLAGVRRLLAVFESRAAALRR